MSKFKKNETILCIAARDESNLTMGTEYLVLEDEEAGIFESRPYVTIQGDHGKPLVCHASRFQRLVDRR